MSLYEHEGYDPRMKDLAKQDDILVAKGKPQHLKVGEPAGDNQIVEDIYVVCVLGQAKPASK